MEGIAIRKYRREDRQSVRDIAWDTAFMGEPASAFFSDKEIFSDFLTLYFTDYEPESCFVAESKGKVVGYLIGSLDEDVLKKVSALNIIPRLVLKAVARCAFLQKNNMAYLSHCLASFLKGEFRDPVFSMTYPAVLHINIDRAFRNSGAGSMLVSAFVEYAASNKIKGVHLSTMSEKAGDFFKKNCFNLIYSVPRSYFKYIIGRDITVYVYGKVMAS